MAYDDDGWWRGLDGLYRRSLGDWLLIVQPLTTNRFSWRARHIVALREWSTQLEGSDLERAKAQAIATAALSNG